MTGIVLSPSRSVIDDEIREIERSLLEMVVLADAMISDSVTALTTLDTQLATEVIRRDDAIDALDVAIETRCLRLFALHQPMASDLRVVGTVLKLITDVERVGDLAVDLAKIARKIEDELGDSSLIDVPRIGQLSVKMLRQAIDAFLRRNVEMARAVCQQDDAVDELYKSFRSQLHRTMIERPDMVVTASYLLLAVHHFERIADHAVNIAERVHFLVTGRFEQIAPTHREDAG